LSAAIFLEIVFPAVILCGIRAFGPVFFAGRYPVRGCEKVAPERE
jgi:hypothetical protein